MNKKGSIPLIAVALIGVLLLGGIVYFARRGKIPPPAPSPSPQTQSQGKSQNPEPDQPDVSFEERLKLINQKYPGAAIPDYAFTPAAGEDKKVLGMQIFWYLNGFWGADNLTGKFDANTSAMLKRFQKETGLAETGRFDEGTILVANSSFEGIPPSVIPEDIAPDESITLGLDPVAPYFRIFLDSNQKLVKGTANSSPVSDIVLNSVGLGTARSSNGKILEEVVSLTYVLNNTLQPVTCTLKDSQGKEVETYIEGKMASSYQLKPNERKEMPNIFSSELDNPAGTFVFTCGGKSLKIVITGSGVGGR